MFPCISLYTYASATVCLEINKDGEMYISAAASIAIQEKTICSCLHFHVGLNMYIRDNACANAFCVCYMRVFCYKGLPSSLVVNFLVTGEEEYVGIRNSIACWRYV